MNIRVYSQNRVCFLCYKKSVNSPYIMHVAVETYFLFQYNERDKIVKIRATHISR